MDTYTKSRLAAGIEQIGRAADRAALAPDEMRPALVFAVMAATLLGRPVAAPLPGRRFICTRYGRVH
jgi:hypothetical protein